MTNNDTLNDIANEDYDPAFGGDVGYSEKRTNTSNNSGLTFYEYKVWNPNPQEAAGTPTPGIIMKTSVKTDGKYEKSQEVVDRVRCVILFTSSGRILGRGRGATYKEVCGSHDALVPSIRINKPLCRTVKAEDVAQTFSQWKGFDQAKVDAKVAEVTEDGHLAICGLKSSNGFITICPFSSEVKNPLTGQRGTCKRHIFIKAYDIERKREFKIQLAGGSIDNNQRFIAPFHEFFKFLRTQGLIVDGKPRGLPSYSFSLELSSLPNGSFYIANFKNWKPIESAENRKEMKIRAEKAKADYEKDAVKMSKEDYEKAKKQNEEKPKQVAAPLVGPPARPDNTTRTSSAQPVKQEVEEAPDWDDDDIPF